MRKRWNGRTSGANIPNIRVYVCDSCQTWHTGDGKPKECRACGYLNFIHFPSKAEAMRYGELMLEQVHKLISDLQLQPRFPLHAVRPFPGGSLSPVYDDPVKIGEYRADFQYKRGDITFVEDVKGGADTTLSAWKRKHAEAEHGIKIQVVRR